ncbi:hypothetical protein [Aquimarina sp. AU119]|uniref:hypothetical protein n=1 Tax=Aquimarina sp. AU119 TaxID=2108528 RepID=UPI000D69643C|nr:hypothetical protein [Aquimarina sp. AU119]
MSNAPLVKINSFSHIENEYNNGENIFHVLKLIEHSKQYQEFDLPLSGIDISTTPWGSSIDIKTFCYHANRIKNADLNFPILLDEYGFICDGWHRVCKAILNNHNSIKAIRLETMPEPDRRSED